MLLKYDPILLFLYIFTIFSSKLTSLKDLKFSDTFIKVAKSCPSLSKNDYSIKGLSLVVLPSLLLLFYCFNKSLMHIKKSLCCGLIHFSGTLFDIVVNKLFN